MGTSADDQGRWTFLTNHAHVLLCLAQSPGVTMRDVAVNVGVTERAVQRIVHDLEAAGYLTRRRSGRQNEYEIDPSLPLRHPVEAHQTVGELLALAQADAPASRRRRSAARAGKPVAPANRRTGASLR